MNARTRCHRHRAFTLMDLIVVLGLMGILATMGGHLFMQSLRIISATHRNDATLSQRQDFMHALRADVWTASALHATDNQTIAIERSDGDRVRWRQFIDDEMIGHPLVVERSVWREGSWQTVKQWRDTRWQVTFAVKPAAIIVHVAATDHLPPAQWLMPATLLMQRESTP